MSIGTILNLKKIEDRRGNLTVVEQFEDVPFDVKRVYWTYDVPSGVWRGGHAHRTLQQVIVALSGSFDVHLDNGHEKEVVHLNHPYQALYIPPMTWDCLRDYSGGSVCLVLTSEYFNEDDYIRNYKVFLKEIKKCK